MAFVNSWRWQSLNITQGVVLPFRSTFLLTYVSIAYNTVLPGSVGGDFVRLYHAGRLMPGKKGELIMTTLLDRVSGLVGLIVIFLFILPFYVSTYRHNNLLSGFFASTTLLYSAIFTILIISSASYLFLRKYPSFYMLNKSRFIQPFRVLMVSLQSFISDKSSLFVCLGMSIITQLLILVVIFTISSIMNLPSIPLMDYVLAMVLAQLANLLPITPGGIGVGEVAFSNVILLLNPGVVGEYATVFLALRLFTSLAYLPGVIYGMYGKYSAPAPSILTESGVVGQNFK